MLKNKTRQNRLEEALKHKYDVFIKLKRTSYLNVPSSDPFYMEFCIRYNYNEYQPIVSCGLYNCQVYTLSGVELIIRNNYFEAFYALIQNILSYKPYYKILLMDIHVDRIDNAKLMLGSSIMKITKYLSTNGRHRALVMFKIS